MSEVSSKNSGTATFGLERLFRLLPIRARILSVAALNTAAILLLLLLIFDGARQLKSAWSDLLQVRSTEKTITSIETESGRLQSLIHRYFTQPAPEVLEEIERRRATLTRLFQNTDGVDPSLSDTLKILATNTERLVAAFDELRKARTEISETYEGKVLRSAREISGLYAILESTISGNDVLIKPPLGRSREAFSASLVAANSYYLSHSANAAQETFNGLDTIERTLPVMLDLTNNDLQRLALSALRQRVGEFRESFQSLSRLFGKQADVLRDSVDHSQSEMTRTTSALSERIRDSETQVQNRLDTTLNDVYAKVAVIAVGFLALVALFGTAIARSVNQPLVEMMAAMKAIVDNKLSGQVSGLNARDELGNMARSIEVFRQNAIAKLRAEDELRMAKERAEAAFLTLRNAQASLIESEKLAALGGLVAGVAHEVNNPVGISLTVATTLERRTADLAADFNSGELRKSKLQDYISSTIDATKQLTANLYRAGDLIQSFKQVAVDRSHDECRTFDLKEATDQIIASLRPSLSKRQISLTLDCPDGIAMNSYPGPYGQVLTNLFVNSVTHAFCDDRSGSIDICIRPEGDHHVRIDFMDTGAGMEEEVRRRAFEPFFTTRRGQGGTGLGLHIIYNIVTQKLGGKIEIVSREDKGTTFTINLPRDVEARHGDDQRR